MKIVYVIDTLASKGGAERIISEKMGYLAEHFGFDVTVVTCYQLPAVHPNAYPLSDKVKQVNIGIPYYSQFKVGYPKRLFVKWSFHRRLKRQLTETITQLKPDILVGVSYFNADMLCSIDCRAAKIVEAHEARLYSLKLDGQNSSSLLNAWVQLYGRHYFRSIEKHADAVVALTNGDAQLWKKARRVEIIPNFSLMPISRLSHCINKRVIAVGRLEWQKGYDLLFEAWKKVEHRHPDWRLDIFGSGRMEATLKEQLASSGLKTVSMIPFTPNISEEYAESSICVLSSRFEGFSLVLLEAMRHGVPGVSFNCPFGPSDVLEDGKCGFVVPAEDVTALADKICLLIEDETLRHQFAAASLERAKFFDTDRIMSKWKSLFEELASE